MTDLTSDHKSEAMCDPPEEMDVLPEREPSEDDSPNDLMSAVIDEIALEGLDGITLDSLWIRLRVRYTTLDAVADKRLDFTSSSVQSFIFDNIIKELSREETLRFYSLPECRPVIGLYNRYQFVNQETGTLIEDPDLIPEDVYGEVTPVADQNSPDIRGSSRHYFERKDVTKDVLKSDMRIEDIDRHFGLSRLVVVADQTHRTSALMADSQPDIDLSNIHYCILERIGRQRYLGEITVTKEAGHYRLTPKTLFYYRKLLLRKNLIKKKQCIVFNLKTVQNIHGQVFTLTRFATDAQSISEANAVKVSQLLMNTDDKQMEYDCVREHLQLRSRSFRLLIQNYSTNFSVISTCDEANKSKRLIRLVKPVCLEDEDEAEAMDDNDDEELGNNSRTIETFDPSLVVADRTLLSQALTIIESHESNGALSMRQLGHSLSLPKLETRSLTRYLEKAGAISSMMVDRGRQKVTMFMPKWKREPTKDRPTATRNTPMLDTTNGLTHSDTNMSNRVNLILDFVKKQVLVDKIYTLKQLVRESEKNSEHKVCNKTIVKIVHKLAAQGLVRSIRTVLTHENRVQKLHFVCLPSITADHPLVKDRISEIKFQLMGRNKFDIQSDKQSSYADNKVKYLFDTRPKNVVMNLVYQPSIARKYGLEPKMKKLLTLYRYLFYLTHGYDPQLQKKLPNTDWRYNIEPLTTGSKSHTCTIGQIVPRMPLSIFVKIVWISHVIPGLQELVSDPVKVNLSLSQISPVVLECLRYRRKYVFNISETLVGLTYLGLVETQYKEGSERESTLITVKNKFSLVANKTKTEFIMRTIKDEEEFEEALQLHCFESCTDCSLDKRLFAHNLRNWTYTPSYKGRHVSANNRLQKISGAQETARHAVSTHKENKRRKNKTDHSSQKNKKKKPNDEPLESKKVKSVASDVSVPSVPSGQSVVTDAKKKVRKKGYDKIDLKAKSLLKKQRTDWTPEEDSFLLISKVVSVLLDPHSASHICVPRIVIRDQLHKYYPNVSNDKTALACGRRITYMLKNPTTRQNVIDYVGELKQQLSISRPDVPRSQQQVWSEAYIKLLHQVLALMQSSRRTNQDNSWTLSFDSLDQLLSQHNILTNSASVLPTKGRLHEDANNVVDIHVNVVTNVLLSSLLSKTYSQTNVTKEEENFFAQTLFRIYQRFPDSLIRSVVTKLNKHGVMTKVKRTTKENLSSLKAKNNSAPYRISQNFLFLMQTKYCLEALLKEDHNLGDDLISIKEGKTGFEAAIVTSLFASQSVQFVKEIPDNIVVLQNDCPLLTSTRSSPKNPMDPKTASRYALHLLRQHLHSHSADRVQHSADYLNVNQCRITCSSTDPFVLKIDSFDELFKKQKQLFTDDFTPGGVRYCASDHKKLLQLIDQKRELGASLDELLAIQARPALDQSLEQLTDKELIFRVGIRTFRWVSRDHVQPWLVRSAPNAEPDKSSNTSEQTLVRFFARYWKRPNGAVDLKVIFKLLCALLGHIMTNPCVAEHKLIEYFDQSLQPVQLLELIELLTAAQCLDVIQTNQLSKATLFGPKIQFTERQIRHYCSTPDSLIRLYRLKQFLEII